MYVTFYNGKMPRNVGIFVIEHTERPVYQIISEISDCKQFDAELNIKAALISETVIRLILREKDGALHI